MVGGGGGGEGVREKEGGAREEKEGGGEDGVAGEDGVVEVVRVDDGEELHWEEVLDAVLSVGGALAVQKQQRRILQRHRSARLAAAAAASAHSARSTAQPTAALALEEHSEGREGGLRDLQPAHQSQS